jgi:hypothetical protein
MAKVSIKLSAIRRTKWYEYLVRFVFGGAITVMAGLIANLYGPVIGGLFLAFPSIFPASVTLVQTHTEEKRQEEGLPGVTFSRKVAGVVAAGTAMGSFGLFGFGLVIWQLSPRWAPWLVLLAALVIWFVVNVAVWYVRKYVLS